MLTVIQGGSLTHLMRGHGIPASGVTHTFILHSMAVCPHVSILEREKRMEHFRENAWRRGIAPVCWVDW